MFQWMGADAQRITPGEIEEGKLTHFDVLYMTGGWTPSYVWDLYGKGGLHPSGSRFSLFDIACHLSPRAFSFKQIKC
jgi:hypothetical protein